MATYHVQITSLWQGDGWHTVAKLSDRKIAERLADELAVSEHEHGINNPGLRGVRRTRVRSQSEIRKAEGSAALVRYNDEWFERQYDDCDILRAERVLDDMLEAAE